MRKKIVRGAVAGVVVLLCVAGAFIGGIFYQNWNRPEPEPPEPVITADLIASEVRNISEYATLAYHYTNVGKFEDRVDFYGWNVPFTSKSFIITYDGAMKLGIQGKDIGVEVVGTEVRITLPEAVLLSHEIYEDTIELLDQTKNIFNQIEIQDYTGFASDQKREMEAKARANGLFEEAKARAAEQIGSLLRSIPGEGEAYTVVFVEPLAAQGSSASESSQESPAAEPQVSPPADPSSMLP